MADISLPSIHVEYHLYLPTGMVWVFHDITQDSRPVEKKPIPYYWSPTGIVVPLDLITAARLRLIKPGDDSGIEEETWAWLKLLSLTGGQP